MIERQLETKIEDDLFKGKVIILLGPRQVGKTTLVKKILGDRPERAIYLNGDLPRTQELLANDDLTRLHEVIGQHDLIVIDEAQWIDNIGLKLKIVVDALPDKQLIVTGSSSLELAGGTKEPLTGRKFQHLLFPISFAELYARDPFNAPVDLENRMIYGSYPEVINNPEQPRRYLDLITESYLYKDLLHQPGIRKLDVLKKLLQALAFQVGHEVSYNELAQTVGADRGTIEHYLEMLEQAFVVFRLTSFSRNLRSELKRSRKIYFWDNGVRNALIANFNPLNLRNDVGALWENYLVSERQKSKHYQQRYSNDYFWRTYDQQEIDYLEERNGRLHAYEFKWNPKKKAKLPVGFTKAYEETDFSIVNRENFVDFVLGKE